MSIYLHFRQREHQEQRHRGIKEYGIGGKSRDKPKHRDQWDVKLGDINILGFDCGCMVTRLSFSKKLFFWLPMLHMQIFIDMYKVESYVNYS